MTRTKSINIDLSQTINCIVVRWTLTDVTLTAAIDVDRLTITDMIDKR